MAHLGLSIDRLVFLRLPDTDAPKDGEAFDDAVGIISGLTLKHGCGSLIATWLHDPHGDHEATYMIAEEAARRSHKNLFAYPVWGWTLPPEAEIATPLPEGVRFDVSSYLLPKRAAIAAYRSQHGLVITDAAESFCLPPKLLSVFACSYEVFLRSSV
jgi:LmbE family N-acetylglucosaminyl deacetylase